MDGWSELAIVNFFYMKLLLWTCVYHNLLKINPLCNIKCNFSWEFLEGTPAKKMDPYGSNLVELIFISNFYYGSIFFIEYRKVELFVGDRLIFIWSGFQKSDLYGLNLVQFIFIKIENYNLLWHECLIFLGIIFFFFFIWPTTQAMSCNMVTFKKKETKRKKEMGIIRSRVWVRPIDNCYAWPLPVTTRKVNSIAHTPGSRDSSLLGY